MGMRSMISDVFIKLRNVYTNFLHRLMVFVIAIIENSKKTRKLHLGGDNLDNLDSDRSSLEMAKLRPKSWDGN